MVWYISTHMDVSMISALQNSQVKSSRPVYESQYLLSKFPSMCLGENHSKFLAPHSSTTTAPSFSLNNFPVHVGIDLIIPRLWKSICIGLENLIWSPMKSAESSCRWWEIIVIVNNSKLTMYMVACNVKVHMSIADYLGFFFFNT